MHDSSFIKLSCFPSAHPERLINSYVLFLFFLVNVKWGKEKFDAVELNTEEPPMVFKAQLFALTGVQPDRQKVMVKGGTLKVWKDTWKITVL